MVYRLRNIEMPWGDYGDILLSGLTDNLDRQDGLLQLQCTAPFVPKLIISGLSNLLVANEVKLALEEMALAGVSFLPVIKHKIVLLDWSKWNKENHEPAEYPINGEPENYILEGEHNEDIANSIVDIWEVVIAESNDADNSKIYKDGLKIIVAASLKEWLQANYGEWIRFEEVKE